jgi:hypothetical protein
MGILIFFALLLGVYFLCTAAFRGAVDIFFGSEDKESTTYIDRSTHTHFHVHTNIESKEIMNPSWRKEWKAAKGSRDIVLYNVDERKYQRELDQWYKKQKKKR